LKKAPGKDFFSAAAQSISINYCAKAVISIFKGTRL